VTKRHRPPSFADIVREAREAPPPPPPRTGPQLWTGRVQDKSGRIWTCVDDEITASRAFVLAADGAAVAWDPCGCGGYCGITWFGPDDVQRMVNAGPPIVARKKHRSGNLSEWATDDGQRLVVAENDVEWAGLLS